ncbi:MAG: MOSC domain-containing protein [Acidimicrobiia bacterium]
MTTRTLPELIAGVDEIRRSPTDRGTVELIVVRPARGERQIVEHVTLDETDGVIGDCWLTRGSSSTPDGAANPIAQVTLMNARALALIAVDPERRALAGDQLIVDFDLSGASMPVGSRFSIGTAVLEVSPKAHTGCAKFVQRYGADAQRFVNTEVGRELNVRGIFAVVITGGTVKLGDTISKLVP